MSKDTSAAGQLYKVGVACIDGALTHGFLFGTVGFLFTPQVTLSYIAFSALTGCIKEGLKTQFQSKALNAAVDIVAGSSGRVLRVVAITAELASLTRYLILEHVVVGGVNGGLYAIPSLLELPDGGNKQHLPGCNSRKKVEVGLSDVLTPLAVEGFEGAFSEYLRVILRAPYVPGYVQSISNGVRVGSVVFTAFTFANLVRAIYTDEPADMQESCAQGRLLDKVSVSGDEAVIKEPDEL